MIPHLFHLFWSGRELSYLRYLTLKTLRHWHSNWKIWLWTTEKWSSMKWDFPQQDFQKVGSRLNYMKDALSLVDKVVPYDKHPDVAPNFQSDFMRWDALLEHGGFYLDMDQIVCGRFDTLCNNDFVYSEYSGRYYYVPVGVMGAKPQSLCVKHWRDQVAKSYNPKDYCCLGPTAAARILGELKKNGLLNKEKALNTGSALFYPIGFSDDVGRIYGRLGFTIPKSSKAMHWFGGHPQSQAFNASYPPERAEYGTDAISRYIRELGLVEGLKSMAGEFEYGFKVDNTIDWNLGRMRLDFCGSVFRYRHPNEKSWAGSVNGKYYTLFGEDNKPTVVLQWNDALKVYSGKCLRPPHRMHYLIPHVSLSPDRLQYVINASRKTFEKGLTKELLTKLAGQVAKDRITVVIGDSPPRTEVIDGVRHCWTDYNGWEYTAMVVATSLFPPDTYAFIMHDTMEIGPNFGWLSSNMNGHGEPDVVYAGLHVEGHQCGWNNLGAYRIAFLNRILPYLKSLNHCSRRVGVEVEVNENNRGIIRKAERVRAYSNCCMLDGPVPVAYHGRARLYRDFLSVDVRKYYTAPEEEANNNLFIEKASS